MNIQNSHKGSFSSRPGSKALRIVGHTIGGVVFAVFFALLFGLVVMVLWNWLMPALFALGKVTFWQAFGIVLLAKLLFGSFGHPHRDPHSRFERHFKDHVGIVGSEEDVAECCGPHPGNGRKWRHFRQFWQEEGRAAFESYLEKVDKKDKK